MFVDYSISAQIDEAGRLQKTTRMVVKVMRAQGIDPVQNLSFSWSLARETRPVVKGRVVTSDGQPHVLDDNSMVEKDPLDPNAVGVIKILAVMLPDVDVDSVVELQVIEGDRAPAFPGARFGTIVIPPGPQIVHFRASITSASPSELHVETRSFPGAKITEAAGKGHTVVVEADKFQPLAVGPFVPPDVAPDPTILFTNVPSWQALAQWYAEVVAKVAPIAQVHAPSTADELSVVGKAYEDLRKKVQDIGTDLDSGPVAPRAPADILKSGTADSKDEAMLLISKLAEAGIPAKLALVSAAPKLDAAPTLPGLEAFDHVLVYIPGSTPLWIDPAAEYTSVGRLPVADQDRSALIIDPQTTQLVHIPASTEKDNRETVETEIHLGDGVPTTVSETLEAVGSFEDALRSTIEQLATSDDAQKERITDQLFQAGGGQTANSTKFSDAHRLLEKSWLQISGDGYGASSISDEGGFVDLPSIARLNLQKFASLLQSAAQTAGQPSARTADFYIAPRFTTVNSFHIVAPIGYRFKEIPSVPVVNIGPLSIATAITLDKDGSLRLIYTMTQPKTRMTIQDLTTMRKDASAIATKASVHIELENVGMAKMQSGDFSEGLKLLRQDASAAKINVNPSLRLASAYVLIGARNAGVKLCEDLLKRNSKPAAGSDQTSSNQSFAVTNLAAIHGRLGWIYEHDEYGRLLAPEMNAAEAEKNLREAADLVRDDPSIAIRLGEFYSYNSAGVHYGRSARLDDAINIFNNLDLNAIVREGKLNDYALLLLHARKYGDLRQLFNYPQADSADQSIKWAEMAVSRSEPELKSELEFRYPSANDRRVLLVLTGRQLISIREYQAASRVLHLAGKGPGVAEAELSRLDRARVFDQTMVSKEPAIATFQRYVQSLLDPENATDWKKFVTTEAQTTLESQRNSVVQFFHSLVGGAENPSAWPYLSDLIATTLSFTAEGNDSIGFRIKISSAANAAPISAAYVIKQGNNYVVAGLANSDAATVQAISQAHAGNMQAARQWLDWEREAAGLPKLADAQVQQALDTASTEISLSNGKPQDAATVLMRLHQQNPSDSTVTFLLADSLILSGRIADAQPYISNLQQNDANSLPALRLKEHLLAQQQNYIEAAVLAKQICEKPNAVAADWNELAWVTLFTSQNSAPAKAAATKAAELTNFSSPAILHTLAIAQASTLQQKDALSTAYKFALISAESGEMETIFGTIAEQSGLPEVASEYYARVPKDDGIRLSNYAFAQLQLHNLQGAGGSSKTRLQTR